MSQDPIARAQFQSVRKLDDNHLGVVALPRSKLKDTSVATLTLSKTRRDIREQLMNKCSIIQVGQRLTPCMHVTALSKSDQTLHKRTNLFGSKLSGLDTLVLYESSGQATKHCGAMTRIGAQAVPLLSVSHSQRLLLCEPQAHRLKLVFDFLDGLGTEVPDVKQITLAALGQLTDGIHSLPLKAVV